MGLPIQRLTLAEFLEWEADQAERHEYHRGEIFAMVGGTARHNRVVLNLAGRIADHIEGTGCQVFAENMKVLLADDGVLYPDVVVTCGRAEAGDEQSISDPKVIIEVLSPSTRGYDRRDKFILYRTLPSLRDYVLIDPERRQVEVFSLAAAGAWLLTDQTRVGSLSLPAIDLVLTFDQIFKGTVGAETLPSTSN